MNKKILSVLGALILVLGFAGVSLANNGAFADFNAQYPGKSYGCTLCHTSPPALNPYGTALKGQGGTANNILPAAFVAVENLDSDADGFTNIAEINADTLPGDPTSHPVTPPPPTLLPIDVTAPTAGEIVPSGSNYNITFNAPAEVTSVKAKFTYDGLTWFPAVGTAGAGSFAWTVPNPPKNQKAVRVKVLGFDASGKIAAGKSAAFTIETVSITSPTTGDTLTGGGTHTITWTTNGTKAAVDRVVLFYSKNNGVTWKRIIKTAAGTGNPGSFLWDNTAENPIPTVAAPKPNSLIKVILKDNTGATVGTAISKKFTIQ